MAGQDITFDEVAAAAQGLAEAGTPVTVGSLRGALPLGDAQALHRHLGSWRAGRAKPTKPPVVEVPDAITTALGQWARQLMDDAAARLSEAHAQTETDLASLLRLTEQADSERDALQTRLAACDARIERLTIELRHARDIASDALVGKAKDHLAIEGKDAQLADLRRQIERHLATSAAESDARLAAEMELVGAVTARDNFAAEIAELRDQLDRPGRSPS